jgi:hypothetical protein
VTWLTPWAGAILAAVVIPPLIVLYFLKLRRRTQPIACTMLWKRAVEDLHANAPFQKLRRSLLLLLQLIVLALLIASIMQPQIHARGNRGGRTVVLIDNSASMTATDTPEGETRLELAKRLAKEQIEAMYAGGLFGGTTGETMVAAFSNRAEVLVRFTDSKQQLLAAVDRIQPTHGTTEIGEALKLARAHTLSTVDPSGEGRAVGEPPKIELFSDGRIADIADQVLRGENTMTFHQIGSEQPDNVAVTAVSVERPYDAPNAIEVFAALVNFNREPVTCDIQLSINEIAPSIKEVTLPGAEVDEETGRVSPGRDNALFRLDNQPYGAVIGVTNLREDDLAADNVAQVVVPPPKKLKVLLVSPDRFLTKKALEGLALEELRASTPDRYEEMVGERGLDAYDLIVFEGYAPETLDLMPPGRYLTFGPTPPLDGLNEYGRDTGGFVLSMQDEHPIFRTIGLDDLFISEQRLLQPADDVEVLAEAGKGPIIIAISRGPMQVIHVAFDPMESSWWLLQSWVKFIYNAVDYLGNLGTGVTTQGFTPGEALKARLPSAAKDIRLLPPDGEEKQLVPLDPAQLSWGPIRLTGLHLLTWETPGAEDRGSEVFAVNLLSERESDLARAEQLTVGTQTVATQGEAEAYYTPLWPWAIGACLAVLMLEWWVYHKKAYV